MATPQPHFGERVRRQYSFGGFTLDLEGGFLRRGSEEVPLRPKPFEVLVHLVEHHGRLVAKDALVEAVWSDAAITDNSLAQCIVEVRRALGDDSQQIIRTVAHRGYVFTAPVVTPVLDFPRAAIALPPDRSPAPWSLNLKLLLGSLLVLAVAAGGSLAVWLRRPSRQEPTYTQITNFTDSAVAPVLSHDGRMLAFFRSDHGFLTKDQIYVKMLPEGEPVQLTHDSRSKCCIAFSPDGTRLAYTALEPETLEWRTYTVSALGGEPRLLLSNAAGLSWLDQRRYLFSEIRTGAHMGIVASGDNHSQYREIYFPPHERTMAHYSYASPDRKWALVLEMDPVWQPCRLVPLDRGPGTRQVGPPGKCTSAAWSPDGKWMYFGAEVSGFHHLWRQRFPAGEPEQITFGPTEEDGVAVAPDGRSLITSLGTYESAIWIHDVQGDRPLSSEGHVAPMRVFPLSSVIFSPDGRSLFYLMRRDSPASESELWRTDLSSGRSEAVLPDVSMAEYDISSDRKEVIFSTELLGKPSQLWLAPLDQSSPPRLIASSGEVTPHFGPAESVLFQLTDGKANYLARMNKDGSGRAKLLPNQIILIGTISPDRLWIAATVISPTSNAGGQMAVPTQGGAPVLICPGYCPVTWAPDGKFLYVGVTADSRSTPGKTLAIPIPSGKMLPKLPPSGIRGVEGIASFPGARLIYGFRISPGADPSVFAYTKTSMHRNLFRIPLWKE